jgi:hypothetical protein
LDNTNRSNTQLNWFKHIPAMSCMDNLLETIIADNIINL